MGKTYVDENFVLQTGEKPRAGIWSKLKGVGEKVVDFFSGDDDKTVRKTSNSIAHSREADEYSLTERLGNRERGISSSSGKDVRKAYHDLLAQVDEGFKDISSHSGHYGAIGPKTREATLKLQKELGLPQTGIADKATIQGIEHLIASRGGHNEQPGATRIAEVKGKEYDLSKAHSHVTPELAGVFQKQGHGGHAFSKDFEVMGTGKISGFGPGCNGYREKRYANNDTFHGEGTLDKHSHIVAVPGRDIGVAGKPQPGDMIEIKYKGRTAYAFCEDIGDLCNKYKKDGKWVRNDFRDLDLTHGLMNHLDIPHSQTSSGGISGVTQNGLVEVRVVARSGTGEFKRYDRMNSSEAMSASRELRKFACEMEGLAKHLNDHGIRGEKADAIINNKILSFYANPSHSYITQTTRTLPELKNQLAHAGGRENARGAN